MEIKTIKENIQAVLEKTDFKNLGERRQGKVRDIYSQPDRLILVATDRYSAFDRNLALIPFKGMCLTQISNFWFDQTKDIISNHVLDSPDPNVVVGKKCSIVPIEVVVRGYITGVTGTSLWTLYSQGKRDFGDFVLPEGLKKNQKLEKPLITPTTKSDEHDRPIISKEIISEKIVEEKLWSQITDTALKLFARGNQVAADKGLILVDTKYEFGTDDQGQLTLIDEIHTPDSSRYWKKESYESRITQGLEPEYFDKEFLRLWFKEHSDPYKDKVLPKAPDDMIAELSSRYIQIYEQLTEKIFDPDLSLAPTERIQNNLKDYFLP
jgi:phosphoribosylaminoimidazole-succinocarboxamide synthase